MEELLNCLEKNEKDGIIYHREEINGDYDDFDELAGVLSVRGTNFISCVFVDKKYHRKGIASKLFNEVISILKENGVDSIRLNSSPYAVPFYHSIGFKNLGVQQEFQGILFTPMELILA